MSAVWTFTGITLILEGVADAVTLCMMHKGEKKEEKK